MTSEFKDFRGLFKDLSGTTMHILKDTPVLPLVYKQPLFYTATDFVP